jgi:hypothetical protein
MFLDVSRRVERDRACRVAVRPSRAAIPPGGMHPGEYRLSLGEEGAIAVLPIWYFLLPVGTVDSYGCYLFMGRIGRREWDSYERVCDSDLFVKHPHARRNYERRHILSSDLFVSELIVCARRGMSQYFTEVVPFTLIELAANLLWRSTRPLFTLLPGFAESWGIVSFKSSRAPGSKTLWQHLS